MKLALSETPKTGFLATRPISIKPIAIILLGTSGKKKRNSIPKHTSETIHSRFVETQGPIQSPLLVKGPKNTRGLLVAFCVRSAVHLTCVTSTVVSTGGAYVGSADLKFKWLVHNHVLYDFLITVKAAPHECVIRTGQP